MTRILPRTLPFGRAAALVQGLALGLGALSPAHAIITPGGSAKPGEPDPGEKSHLEGSKFTSVAALKVQGQLKDSEPYRNNACAVYVRLAEDDKSGMMLTSAHLFAPSEAKPIEKLESATLCFGPDSSSALAIQAVRVVYPKAFKPGERATLRKEVEEGKAEPRPIHDLAILELDEKAVETLKAKGIEPVGLYEGKALEPGQLVGGQIVGFGLHGTSTSATVTPFGRVNCGRTTLTYGSWGGQVAFHGWVIWSPAGIQANESGFPGANAWQFLPLDKKSTIRALEGKSSLEAESNAEQSIPVFGDSGSPFFMKSKSRGQLVVGIYSGLAIVKAKLDGSSEPDSFLHSDWEPVQDALTWIRAAHAGKLEDSVVVDLTPKD